jgi:hypothetical protein
MAMDAEVVAWQNNRGFDPAGRVKQTARLGRTWFQAGALKEDIAERRADGARQKTENPGATRGKSVSHSGSHSRVELPLPALPSRAGEAEGALCEALDELTGRYGLVILDRERVLAFLGQYPEMKDVLAGVSAAARREFGAAAELVVEVRRDPEAPDSYLRLCARVWPYDDTVMQRIEDLTTNLEDELSRGSGFFLLTTDFRKPGLRHGTV